MAGQFFWIDAIAMDSYGNLYTGEVWAGRRIHNFKQATGRVSGDSAPHE